MNDENESVNTPLTPYVAWRLAIDEAAAEYVRARDAANAVYALATAREETENL